MLPSMLKNPWRICVAIVLACVLAWLGDCVAADRLQIAQEIVLLKKVPLSRSLSFEEAGQPARANYFTLLLLMDLNMGQDWNMGHPQWDSIFSAVHREVETLYKKWWSEVNEQAVASGYHAERSLAVRFAEGLSDEHMAELLAFYRSPIGKKYLAYVDLLQATVAQGQYEAMKIMVDPTLATGGNRLRDRVGILQKRGLPPPSQEAMQFYMEQVTYAGISGGNLDSLLRLGLGTQLLGKKFEAFSQSLATTEQQAIRTFQQSVAAKKEREIIQEWTNTVQSNLKINTKNTDLQKAIAELKPKWRKQAQEHILLARRTTVDLAIAGLKPGLNLNSFSPLEYSCAPSASVAEEVECNKVEPGNVLGVAATAVKLQFKKGRLYYISVELSGDVSGIIGGLEKTFGLPVEKKQDHGGLTQAAWLESIDRVLLLQERNGRQVTIQLVDSQIGESRKR